MTLLQSELKYLAHQTLSSRWRLSFHPVIRRAPQIRVTQVRSLFAAGWRSMPCMACGETHQQKSVVDLYGDYDSEAWVQNPRALDAAWHEFCEAHFAIYDDDILAGQKAAAASGTLPPEDRGTYLLGGSCLLRSLRSLDHHTIFQ